jgi:hypothetical protein
MGNGANDLDEVEIVSYDRLLHDCSGCFRLERLPGGPRTHWKAPPFHGAHPTRTFSFYKSACALSVREN